MRAVQMPDGNLYTEVDGNRTLVATGVTWVAAPPNSPDTSARP